MNILVWASFDIFARGPSQVDAIFLSSFFQTFVFAAGRVGHSFDHSFLICHGRFASPRVGLIAERVACPSDLGKGILAYGIAGCKYPDLGG